MPSTGDIAREKSCEVGAEANLVLKATETEKIEGRNGEGQDTPGKAKAWVGTRPGEGEEKGDAFSLYVVREVQVVHSESCRFVWPFCSLCWLW